MEQPKIPTLKDAQKPQVKLKGLGAGLTMLDRLKQFKKKDLAFILAGLGTLFMAPLAEHFMMSPENGDGQLQQGWGGGRSGASLFGSGGSPYEGGLNGISQGGAIGGGGDIITPLNVRDPSALIMGPGSSQQPPAGAVTPPTPPPSAPARSDSDMRDALAASAARAATAATKKAPLPVPKVALGGSGLRGLGAASGGSSSSAGLGPIAGGPRSAASGGGGGLNMVRAAPGYRGAAGARGSANPTGLDNVKKAAGQAGDAFSRTGNAMSGLQEAAGQNIPQGGSGFGGNGQGGAGPNDKSPGGNGPGGSKSVGESLAFIAAKQRMEKELELEFEKRKKGDPELLWYDIRNEMLKTIANKGIAEPLAEAMKGIVGSGAASGDAAGETLIACDGYNGGNPMRVGSQIKKCDAEGKNKPCYDAGSSSVVTIAGNFKCKATTTGKEENSASRSRRGVGQPSRDGLGEEVATNLNGLCNRLNNNLIPVRADLAKWQRNSRATSSSDASEMVKKFTSEEAELVRLMTVVGNLYGVKNALDGSGAADPNPCATAEVKPNLHKIAYLDPAKSVKAKYGEIRKAVVGEDGKGGFVKELADSYQGEKVAAIDKKQDIMTLANDFAAANATFRDAKEALGEVRLSDLEFNAIQADAGTRSALEDVKTTRGTLMAFVTKLEKENEALSKGMAGLVASGAQAQDFPDGSVKEVAEASDQYGKAIEKAKTTMLADGKTPVISEADLTAFNQATALDASLDEGDGAAGEETLAQGALRAATAAREAKAAIAEAVQALDGATDEIKKTAKTKLIGATAGDASAAGKKVNTARTTQTAILDSTAEIIKSSNKPTDSPQSTQP